MIISMTFFRNSLLKKAEEKGRSCLKRYKVFKSTIVPLLKVVKKKASLSVKHANKNSA